MSRIAVWYHCRLSGGEIPINTFYAATILGEQMRALFQSRLLAEADEFHVGINGDESDLELARLFVTCPDAKFMLHGSGMTTEIPTLAALRRWLPDHRDWLVLYHHIKGVTHPGEILYDHWRRCMERELILNWRRCVADLQGTADTCGCHWLTPGHYPNLVRSPFWGGTFWWAKAEYLLTLPELPLACWQNRFEAELWIGKSSRRPITRDYHPAWPGNGCAK